MSLIAVNIHITIPNESLQYLKKTLFWVHADIPQVVNLKKLDKLCPKVEENEGHVFHSSTLRK